MSKYIIVEHAGSYWPLHFKTDPKLVAQDLKLSLGKELKGVEEQIKEFYTDIDEATHDCNRFNDKYKLSDCGVCSLKENQ